MFAVVEVAGFQYRVEPEQVIQVPKVEGEPGSSLVFDRVLLVGNGDDVRVGTPVVEGASVKAEVLTHDRTKKLRAGRFIRRKDHRKTWGHRQDYTEIRITGITG